MKTLALLCALVAVALVGCGDDEPAGDGASGGGASAISIDDALASGSDDELLVSGLLLADGDDVRLCSALAESFPPQCGGASLAVVGLSLDEVVGLVTHGDQSWTDRPVELLGVVADETLTVGGTGLAGGAGGDSTDARPGPAVEVTVTFWPKGKGGPSREATLTCDPTGGTHPDAESACAALAAGPAALEPVPPDMACTMIFGGPEEATVTGVVNGADVDAAFSRSNGCELARWDSLTPLLEIAA